MRKIKPKKNKENTKDSFFNKINSTIIGGNLINVEDMVDIEINKIANMGTINGFKRLNEILGREYKFKNISFLAIEDEFFDEDKDEKYFDMKNCMVNVKEGSIYFGNEMRTVEIDFDNPLDGEFFQGNDIGFADSGETLFRSIEFSIEGYSIDVSFDEFDLFEKLSK